MYVCNLLGDKERVFRNGLITLSQEEPVEVKPFMLCEDGTIKQGVNGENIFLKGLDGEPDEVYRVGKPSGRKGKITYKMIKDTDDNPLIAVLCKSLTVYEGIEAELRFINLGEDAMLVMLVSGICEFDGTTMRRCNTMNYEGRKSYTYNAEELKKLSDQLYYDSKVDYCYSDDVLCSFVLTRDVENSISVKSTVKEPIFLNRCKYDNAIKVYEERQAKKQAELEARRAERKRLDEIARAEKEAKAAIEAEREKARLDKIKNKAKLKADKSTGKPKKTTLEGSEGAAAFLAAVRGL